jgi:hypothetical protein
MVITAAEPGLSAEILGAHISAVKAKTFATIDARFEESEQDLVTHKADTAIELSDGLTEARITPHLHEDVEYQNLTLDYTKFDFFPSSVYDAGLIITAYRKGLTHVGVDGDLHVVVKGSDGVITDYLALSDALDLRDPSILRDDYGHAIKVGGRYPVVYFKHDGTTSTGTFVGYINPANNYAVENETLISNVYKSSCSDFKKLLDGRYALFLYHAGIFGFFTSTDLITWTLVSVPFNCDETGWTETKAGWIEAVCRTPYGIEDLLHLRSIDNGATWIKRPKTQYKKVIFQEGFTGLYGHAPKIVKLANTALSKNGYMVVFRGNTLYTDFATNKSLVASNLSTAQADSYDKDKIDIFLNAQVLMNSKSRHDNRDGQDGFYSSAITFPNRDKVYITTYLPEEGNLETMYVTRSIALLEGIMPASRFVEIKRARRGIPNKLPNGNFKQGTQGWTLPVWTDTTFTVESDGLKIKSTSVQDPPASTLYSDKFPVDKHKSYALSVDMTGIIGATNHLAMNVLNGDTSAVLYTVILDSRYYDATRKTLKLRINTGDCLNLIVRFVWYGSIGETKIHSVYVAPTEEYVFNPSKDSLKVWTSSSASENRFADGIVKEYGFTVIQGTGTNTVTNAIAFRGVYTKLIGLTLTMAGTVAYFVTNANLPTNLGFNFQVATRDGSVFSSAQNAFYEATFIK